MATSANEPQRHLPLLGEVGDLQDAPAELVRQCRHRADAIRLCASLSGLDYSTIAARLGIDKGHFTRIMQGRASLPDHLSVDFMRLCRNRAPAQYEAHALNCDLVPRAKDARIRELEAEIAALRAGDRRLALPKLCVA